MERVGKEYDLTTTPSICPTCGKQLDGAAGVDHDDAPKPCDASICVYCTTFLLFNDDLTLRAMTEEDIADLEDPVRIELKRVRRIFQEVNRKLGRSPPSSPGQ